MTDSEDDSSRFRTRARARKPTARAGVHAMAARRAEVPAGEGRTLYPRGADPGRAAFVEGRERRAFAERLADAQLAAQLPQGRARHLVSRFPPLQGVGGLELYGGEEREAALAGLYQRVVESLPELVPLPHDLAEAAELGEESVVDLLLAGVDRDARLLIDESPDRLRTPSGAQQILDALLMVAEDGHAPGTRVRVNSGASAGRTATVIGAVWGTSGAPVGYRIKDESTGSESGAATGDLVVLAGQESLGR